MKIAVSPASAANPMLFKFGTDITSELPQSARRISDDGDFSPVKAFSVSPVMTAVPSMETVRVQVFTSSSSSCCSFLFSAVISSFKLVVGLFARLMVIYG